MHQGYMMFRLKLAIIKSVPDISLMWILQLVSNILIFASCNPLYIFDTNKQTNLKPNLHCYYIAKYKIK
jgi:hypothetical protein